MCYSPLQLHTAVTECIMLKAETTERNDFNIRLFQK